MERRAMKNIDIIEKSKKDTKQGRYYGGFNFIFIIFIFFFLFSGGCFGLNEKK